MNVSCAEGVSTTGEATALEGNSWAIARIEQKRSERGDSPDGESESRWRWLQPRPARERPPLWRRSLRVGPKPDACAAGLGRRAAGLDSRGTPLQRRVAEQEGRAPTPRRCAAALRGRRAGRGCRSSTGHRSGAFPRHRRREPRPWCMGTATDNKKAASLRLEGLCERNGTAGATRLSPPSREPASRTAFPAHRAGFPGRGACRRP